MMWKFLVLIDQPVIKGTSIQGKILYLAGHVTYHMMRREIGGENIDIGARKSLSKNASHDHNVLNKLFVTFEMSVVGSPSS